MHEWEIKDSKNNTIRFNAPSKTQAKKLYKNMFPGQIVVSIEDRGELNEPPMFRSVEQLENPRFSPTPPIRKKKFASRNKPCVCESGKKYKHCCGSPRGRTEDGGGKKQLRAVQPREGDEVALPGRLDDRDGLQDVQGADDGS